MSEHDNSSPALPVDPSRVGMRPELGEEHGADVLRELQRDADSPVPLETLLEADRLLHSARGTAFLDDPTTNDRAAAMLNAGLSPRHTTPAHVAAALEQWRAQHPNEDISDGVEPILTAAQDSMLADDRDWHRTQHHHVLEGLPGKPSPTPTQRVVSRIGAAVRQLQNSVLFRKWAEEVPRATQEDLVRATGGPHPTLSLEHATQLLATPSGRPVAAWLTPAHVAASLDEWRTHNPDHPFLDHAPDILTAAIDAFSHDRDRAKLVVDVEHWEGARGDEVEAALNPRELLAHRARKRDEYQQLTERSEQAFRASPEYAREHARFVAGGPALSRETSEHIATYHPRTGVVVLHEKRLARDTRELFEPRSSGLRAPEGPRTAQEQILDGTVDGRSPADRRAADDKEGASRAAAEALVAARLGEQARIYDPQENGRYRGAVIARTDHHVVQEITPHAVVIHEARGALQQLQAGEVTLGIIYQAHVASVRELAPLALRRERGGERER